MSVPIAQYAAWSLDESLRHKSTSGGVFTELALAMFHRGGIVVAAGWKTDPLRVVHKTAYSAKDISDMRGAKYAPSDMSGAWRAIANSLKSGIPCLFVGTPCQTASIRRKFEDGNGLLCLCAIFCHSVPELAIWSKYVNEIEVKAGKRLKSVQFRSKTNGGTWRKGMFVAEFEDSGDRIIEPLAGNVYGDAFFMRLSTRASCLKCQFKSGNSGADLMIGDFWGVEKSHPEIDDGKGVNAVLVYTEEGASLFSETRCVRSAVTYDEIVTHNHHLEESVSCDINQRERFLEYCNTSSICAALAKIRHRPLWLRAFYKIRNMVIR